MDPDSKTYGVPRISELYEEEAFEALIDLLRREGGKSMKALFDYRPVDRVIAELEKRSAEGRRFLEIWRAIDRIPIQEVATNGVLNAELQEHIRNLQFLVKSIVEA